MKLDAEVQFGSQSVLKTLPIFGIETRVTIYRNVQRNSVKSNGGRHMHICHNSPEINMWLEMKWSTWSSSNGQRQLGWHHAVATWNGGRLQLTGELRVLGFDLETCRTLGNIYIIDDTSAGAIRYGERENRSHDRDPNRCGTLYLGWRQARWLVGKLVNHRDS